MTQVVEVSALFPADVRDDNGQSPLDRALEDVDDEDHLDLGLYLVSHGCGGYEGKVKLMCGACSWGSQDVVEELVELHNVDPRGECLYCSTMHHIVIHHLLYHCLFSLC